MELLYKLKNNLKSKTLINKVASSFKGDMWREFAFGKVGLFFDLKDQLNNIK